MRANELVPKNPLQAQAQTLQKRATALSNTAKQQNAAERVRKAQQQLTKANAADVTLTQKLQTPTSKQPGT